jgi:hypothetical protein
MEEKQIVEALPFQKKFLDSEARYPALVSGIGTGKTFMLLLKIWAFCETYPNSLALIVRKEFTDLKDSTMKDFARYFNATIGSDKEYKFNNGSIIMFRHAAEIAVLKNINLSIFGIEQAEEFANEETFTFLRDRLRREGSAYRQGCLIANANGHNWIWRMWLNNPASEDFKIWTASTFDNAENLPQDFIQDLKHMEKESPNHYKQYVLNSFEEVGADDLLLDSQTVYNAPNIILEPGMSRTKILGIDVARFGDDETVFTCIEQKNLFQWEQIFQEAHKGKDTSWTTGYAIDISKRLGVNSIIVDDIGIGGAVTDGLRNNNRPVIPFLGNEVSRRPDLYENRKAEAFFVLKDLLDRGWLKLNTDIMLAEQLLSIRYKFKANGKKAIIGKDEMRKEGLKSPDRAEAICMAAFASQLSTASVNLGSLPRQAEMATTIS